MAATPNRRSQALFRLPVDQQSATMTLHDGSRSEIELFLTGGETIPRILTDGPPFLPVIRRKNVALVARSAIACVSVVETPIATATATDTEVPTVRQKAHVHLKSGVVIEGELAWTAVVGHQRTADHLNDATPYFTVLGAGVTHYVVKAHVAIVEEK